jgi:hypothetical protein
MSLNSAVAQRYSGEIQMQSVTTIKRETVPIGG